MDLKNILVFALISGGTLLLMTFDDILKLWRSQFMHHGTKKHYNTNIVQSSQVNAGFQYKNYPNATKNSLVVHKSILPQTVPTQQTRSKQTKILYMKFDGRLGNMLFQLAGLYGLAMTTNCSKMRFQDSPLIAKITRLFPKTKSLLKTVPALPPRLMRIFEQKGGHFDFSLAHKISAAKTSVLVGTYLMATLYWRPKYEKEVKDMITISQELARGAKKLLFDIARMSNISLESRRNNIEPGISPKLRSNQPTLVGIQIRRGDRVANPACIIPDKGYFKRAMNHFRAKYKSIFFIVVSEDKKWGRENIVGADVLHSTSDVDILELTLLSLCDHTIMSIGTFSWWAAYLTGGDVVYYRDHVPKVGIYANWLNDSQFFLPHWKPMV